jgi:hypothetical protein
VGLLELHRQVARLPQRPPRGLQGRGQAPGECVCELLAYGTRRDELVESGRQVGGGEVAGEWVSPLLPANKGKLSTGLGAVGVGQGR